MAVPPLSKLNWGLGSDTIPSGYRSVQSAFLGSTSIMISGL